MKIAVLLFLISLIFFGCSDNPSTKIENCADSYWARDNHFYKEHPDKVKDWKRKASGWEEKKSFKKKRDEVNYKTYEDQYRATYKAEQAFLKKEISEKLLIDDYERYYFKACEKEREQTPITFDEKYKSFVLEMSDY